MTISTIASTVRQAAGPVPESYQVVVADVILALTEREQAIIDLIQEEARSRGWEQQADLLLDLVAEAITDEDPMDDDPAAALAEQIESVVATLNGLISEYRTARSR